MGILKECVLFLRAMLIPQVHLDIENLALRQQLTLLNERHLCRILTDYFDYYHNSRPHLPLNRNSPTPRETEPPSQGEVISIRQIGGMQGFFVAIFSVVTQFDVCPVGCYNFRMEFLGRTPFQAGVLKTHTESTTIPLVPSSGRVPRNSPETREPFRSIGKRFALPTLTLAQRCSRCVSCLSRCLQRWFLACFADRPSPRELSP